MNRIDYQNEQVVEENDPGLTLLAISHKHGIAHASACGGQAKCSTCRVLVLDGGENLTARTEAEGSLAVQKGLQDNIRLACQARATGPVTLRRLVFDDSDRELAAISGIRSSGREMVLAILFSDLRNFTHFTESFLPYDVVHILNRYFNCMGGAVLKHSGHIDKYIGDGLMALFGLEHKDPARACEEAVRAALDMVDELAGMNEYLDRQFATQLNIGIGIHVGEVIVGDMGHPKKMQFTAIGDPVNVASRIESATKDFGAKILVSRDVDAMISEKIQVGRRCRVALRGKAEPMELAEVLGMGAGGGLVVSEHG